MASEKHSTTYWTLIHNAQHLPHDHPLRRQCLDYLAEHWGETVRAMMRRHGMRDEHDLADVTQEFFMNFLKRNELDRLDRAKGRLRNYLYTASRNFLATYKNKQNRHPFAELPDDAALPGKTPSPEHLFYRDWALAILNKGDSRFREYCRERHLEHYCLVLERHARRGGEDVPSLRETAELLGGGTTEGMVSDYLFHARDRYAKILRAVVRHTVNGSERDVDDELDLLRSFL